MDELVAFIIGVFVSALLCLFVWFVTPIAVHLNDGRVVAAESHNLHWVELPLKKK